MALVTKVEKRARGLILRGGAAEDVIEASDVREITELLTGRAAVVELSDHLVQDLLFGNRNGDLREALKPNAQNQRSSYQKLICRIAPMKNSPFQPNLRRLANLI